MSAPLCFVDTETTGVHPDRRVWEVAMIRREGGTQRETVMQVADVDLSNADPFGLKVGRFYERHAFYGGGDAPTFTEQAVAVAVEDWTRGAHLVGAVPNFDADCLDKMLRRHRLIPAWHYHLIDVEAMAVGWLHAHAADMAENGYHADALHLRNVASPPWKSDHLGDALGIPPPGDDERHTALGDARWAMRWYDAMTGGQP